MILQSFPYMGGGQGWVDPLPAENLLISPFPQSRKTSQPADPLPTIFLFLLLPPPLAVVIAPVSS